MKRNEKKETKVAYDTLNEIKVRGTITFSREITDKVGSIGIKIPTTTPNGNTAFALAVFKVFMNTLTDEELNCLEKDNDVEIIGHFSSSKYTNKEGNEVIAVDNILEHVTMIK